jgi:hypothetical protein
MAKQDPRVMLVTAGPLVQLGILVLRVLQGQEVNLDRKALRVSLVIGDQMDLQVLWEQLDPLDLLAR